MLLLCGTAGSAAMSRHAAEYELEHACCIRLQTWTQMQHNNTAYLMNSPAESAVPLSRVKDMSMAGKDGFGKASKCFEGSWSGSSCIHMDQVTG